MSVPSRLEIGRPPPSASAHSLRLANGRVRLWLERQMTAPLSGHPEAPILLFRFTPEGRRPGDVFLLLAAGRSARVDWTGPVDVLAAACADVRVSSAAADGRWRRDAGVRALAHELRRALLERGTSADGYFEHLVRAMFLRAQTIAAGREFAVANALPAPRLERVLEAVEARLREPLSVGDLARIAGMSRARFSEAFRLSVGVTPYAYLRERRLQAVREALDAGESDLARLAARFGFSSHAHMTTAFRQAFGVTPSAYRRAAGEGATRPSLPHPCGNSGALEPSAAPW